MTTRPHPADSFGAAVMASNAATSDFYKSLTDCGIDPHAPAGPDADDLADMGYVNCHECDLLTDEFTDCPMGKLCADCHAGCRQGCEIG